ncbi:MULTISPECIES: FG-GAP repeat domain-containing protein [unclassified Streptomyces]|uniref:FG-GAP repeat domain-containing protein n=1 Tax=unclassified Streptomyces TaxID=2593676 RepID=UPI002DDC203C|nr:VCBS repeat-containing protein [Streptomyces sp. NBC_01257]WRZ67001.1 VCBS repeat-containing protein [Streptomyces sp. NBC_01257]WSU61009.1 VCBS repeat-containing protein [Streptomyces sp. NBC_01104]
MINIRRRRALRGALAATAVTAAMVVTAGTASASGDPAGADRARAAAETAHGAPQAPKQGLRAAAELVETPTFPMTAVHKKTANLYLYFADRKGGFEPQYDVGVTYEFAAAAIDVDNDKDGYSEATWNLRKDGTLHYTWSDDLDVYTKQVGKGWNIYTTVLSPGNLGGAKEADLIGLDKAGVLWGYLGYPDGTVTSRTRIGGGWGQYTQLAGQADLTGDGKADIVARDTSGVLWLYKGTGNYKAPFAARTKVGGGWNTYDRLLSVGDLDSDGKTDLIARKTNGDLFRYSGTGNAAAVFGSPVNIGHGFQAYNLL